MKSLRQSQWLRLDCGLYLASFFVVTYLEMQGGTKPVITLGVSLWEYASCASEGAENRLYRVYSNRFKVCLGLCRMGNGFPNKARILKVCIDRQPHWDITRVFGMGKAGFQSGMLRIITSAKACFNEVLMKAP